MSYVTDLNKISGQLAIIWVFTCFRMSTNKCINNSCLCTEIVETVIGQHILTLKKTHTSPLLPVFMMFLFVLTGTKGHSSFYVFCKPVCKAIQPGKLRVRCRDCKQGTLTLSRVCIWTHMPLELLVLTRYFHCIQFTTDMFLFVWRSEDI